jgi:hypothetical protein
MQLNIQSWVVEKTTQTNKRAALSKENITNEGGGGEIKTGKKVLRLQETWEMKTMCMSVMLHCVSSVQKIIIPTKTSKVRWNVFCKSSLYCLNSKESESNRLQLKEITTNEYKTHFHSTTTSKLNSQTKLLPALKS